jgi:hypothetical protein
MRAAIVGFGALDLLHRQLEAFLDVPDHLGLEQVALAAQHRRLAERKIERTQHMETFMGFAQIRMGFLDDDSGLGEALRCLAGDGNDFRIDRRDAEIGRIGNTFWSFAGTRRGQKGRRQQRQRQRIGRLLAAHGVEQQREILDIARHRALDTEIAIDRRDRGVRDAADARSQTHDAAEARGVTQRAAHVGAVRQPRHAGRERNRGTP